MTDYFTLAELRAMPGMGNASEFTDTQLTNARDWITAVVERVCNTSFVAGSVTETIDGPGLSGSLVLRDPHATAVTAVTVGGVAYSGPEIAALTLRGGVLRQSVGGVWPYGLGNISVTYTAGYSTTVPNDLKQAMLKAAAYQVKTTYNDSMYQSSKQTSISNDIGGTTVLAIADSKEHPTGLPDVDAVITGYANQLDVYGFA